MYPPGNELVQDGPPRLEHEIGQGHGTAEATTMEPDAGAPDTRAPANGNDQLREGAAKLSADISRVSAEFGKRATAAWKQVQPHVETARQRFLAAWAARPWTVIGVILVTLMLGFLGLRACGGGGSDLDAVSERMRAEYNEDVDSEYQITTAEAETALVALSDTLDTPVDEIEFQEFEDYLNGYYYEDDGW
jgi:hypothetical protein